LDGGSWAPCTSPLTLSALADGQHDLAVAAVGPGGTDPTPAHAVWTVDATAPGVSFTGGPSAVTSSTTAHLTFASSDPAATFECQVDGAAWVSCVSPLDLSGLAQGTHSVGVRATDASGNTTPTPAVYSWTVDTTAPNVSITVHPAKATRSTTPGFSFTSTDSTATFECQLDGAPWAACKSPKNYTGLSEGSHVFSVRAKDPAGNVTATPATWAWTIDLTAPTVSITGGPSGTVTQTSASFTFATNDATAKLTCSLDGGAWTACTSPASYTGLASGTHQFGVRATDAVGNVGSATQSWTIA
jgi:hypothetical protein